MSACDLHRPTGVDLRDESFPRSTGGCRTTCAHAAYHAEIATGRLGIERLTVAAAKETDVPIERVQTSFPLVGGG